MSPPSQDRFSMAMAPVSLPPLRPIQSGPMPQPPQFECTSSVQFDTMSTLKIVEDCVKGVVEVRSLANLSSMDQLQICIEMQGLNKNVLSMLQSLSPATRSLYPLERYLVPYLEGQSSSEVRFDGDFYRNWLEVMRVVLGVPKSKLTVIEIGNISRAPAQQ